jgi:hypothetical protein
MTTKNTKPVVLAQDHDLVVHEEISNVVIGGKDVAFKRFLVPRSEEMQNYLNQQSLVKAASPHVSDKMISDALGSLTGMITNSNGSGKKGMARIAKVIMNVFVSPTPESVFGGECDAIIDKKVCSGAVMSRIQKELPSAIPTLFMSNFF